NDSGSVGCGLYASPDGFREPGREMRGAVAPIKNGLATCVFNGVPAGTYAIAVFHAEHNETQNKTRSAAQGVALANPPRGDIERKRLFAPVANLPRSITGIPARSFEWIATP